MSRATPASVARLFLRLGATAFGGPAAHIALMHHEVVRRREWMNDQAFLDRIGLTSLIPGPSSTELAMLVGSAVAGPLGLVVGGLAFILPAVAIVVALAWAYVNYGDTPVLVSLLYGMKPVLIAVIALALVSLTRHVARSPLLAVVAIAALALYLLRINEISLLVSAGLLVMFLKVPPLSIRLHGVASAGPTWVLAAGIEGSRELVSVFLVFLKIGAVLYGSGYVLLAFLRADVVERLGWISGEELLDAVAIGQATPGPLFSTATFVGYLVGGLPGALVASLGIFLPSFVLAALVGAIAGRVRNSPRAGAFLDGVNAAALGLMGGVTLELGRGAIVDVPTMTLALGAGFVLWRFELNSMWVIAAGALVGIALGAP